MAAAQHGISSAQILRRGSAYRNNDTIAGKERGSRGIVTSHLLYYSLGTPIVADPDGIAQAQAVAAPGDLTLNGALASGGAVTLDVPRVLSIDSSGADTTQTATIYGTDEYGRAMVEAIAFNGTTQVDGLKAFKTISRVAIDIALAGNGFCGTTDKLGLPYAVGTGDLVAARGGNAADTGTFVPAVTTNPATAITGDVRGTFDPSTTLNGSTEIQVLLNIPDSSDAAYGVAQFAG